MSKKDILNLAKMIYTLFDELHWLVEQGIDDIISNIEENVGDVFIKEDIETQAKELEDYKQKANEYVQKLKKALEK